MTQPVAVVDGTFAGTDPHAVYALQRSEIRAPHVLALAELPQVGPHAAGVGRLVANLGMPFELRSYGWQLQRGERITATEQLRAVSHRNSVLQALADVAETAPVEHVSVRLLGPVALSVAAMLPSGQRILRDPGARRDIAAAWAEGVAGLLDRIHDVLGARTTVMVQEAEAAKAVDGQIRSVSGVDVERALDISELRDMWRPVAGLEARGATVLLDTPAQLAPTAAQVASVVVEWPTGRSRRTEQTWQRVDQLLQTETPVGFYLRPHGDPQRVAEDLVDEFLGWGLAPEHLEHVRFVRRFAQDTDVVVGAGLEWLRTVTDHVHQYVT